MRKELNVELAKKLAAITVEYSPRLTRKDIAHNLICGSVVVLQSSGMSMKEIENFISGALKEAIWMALEYPP